MTLLYENLTYILRGMFFKVYNDLGPGFKEEVYIKALLKLLNDRKIPYEQEKYFDVNFEGSEIGKTIIDLVVDNKIVVEVKATNIMNSVFEKQLLSYLRSTGLSLGFLVNFGMHKLFIKRYINTIRVINKSRY